MKLTDFISNAFVNNATGGFILGGSAGSLASAATFGAIIGVTLGVYIFCTNVIEKEKESAKNAGNTE